MTEIFDSVKLCIKVLLDLNHKLVHNSIDGGIIHSSGDKAYVKFSHEFLGDVIIMLSKEVFESIKNKESIDFENLPVYSETYKDNTHTLYIDFKKEYEEKLDLIYSEILERINDYTSIFGRVESLRIMNNLNNSRTFISNLETSLQILDVPNRATLEAIIRGATYKHFFAKKRVIYFGSLYYLIVLIEKYKIKKTKVDLGKLQRSFSQICLNHY